ncbi:MAG: S16 family serine protease [Candidatus Micrarchaeia archaeon]
MRFFLLLIAFISLAMAQCQGSISGYVPAVVGDGGGLVNVTIDLVPGHGTAFVSVFPRTGTSTQDSVEQAAFYAYKLANGGGDCDVLVDFGAKPTTDLIDGPSAGTALTVMTYALIEGRQLRNDTIITGTIDKAGNVGAVGGLLEKAKGAASVHARYFITPEESFYEMLLLRDIEKDYGIKVLQARKVQEVIGFMTENKSIEQDGLVVRNREIPALPGYDAGASKALAPLAESMIENERNLTASISDGHEDTKAIRDYFDNEVKRQKAIAAGGYYFSAANEAFLNNIDLSSIKIVLNGSADLARTKGEIGKCLTGIKRPALTDRNYEWVIGADQRIQWAYERLNSIDASQTRTADERFVVFNDLMYAQMWCDVAKGLVAAAPAGGTPVDEGAWKPLAEQKIRQARLKGTTATDTASKLNSASGSFDKGQFGAAIYDAEYVLQTEGGAVDPGNESAIGGRKASLWGSVYESHAAFLYAQNLTSPALQTERYAIAIEDDTLRMKGLAAARPQPAEESPARDDTALIYAAAIISIFLLIVVVLLLTSGKHGNNGQRDLKTFRAKQKKG